MYNYGCYVPPIPPRDDCCCKEGITCALDWFFQDFLSTTPKIAEGSLQYFPVLGPSDNPLSNIIYGIPYISPDIVPTYVTPPAGGAAAPYCGDITYLNICEIEGFSFQLNPDNQNSATTANEIQTRFSKIKYVSPSICCCKNGLMEYLLKAKDFLTNPCICQEGQGSDVSVTIYTCKNSYTATSILAINPDTVWVQNVVSGETPTTTYYVISLCKIVGIKFNRTTVTPPADTGTGTDTNAQRM